MILIIGKTAMNSLQSFIFGFMLSAKDQLLLLISTPFYMIIIGIEIFVSNARTRASYTVKDTIQNIYLNLLNAGLDLGFRAVYVGIILTFFYNHRLTPGISYAVVILDCNNRV